MQQIIYDNTWSKFLADHKESEMSSLNIDIDQYFRKFGPMVLRRCKSLLADEDAAYDAMQEVFIKLLRYKNTLNNQHPSSLLYRIATNICFNMLRQNKRLVHQSNEMLENIEALEQLENKVIAQDLIDHIFRDQKSSTRTIAIMKYIDKMTLAEIASETGLSISGVRKRLEKIKKIGIEFRDNR